MEPGAQNAIIGDVGDMPVTQVPEQVLNEEKNLARFSRSKEFKKLKDYLETRIVFFQKYLPNGASINGGTDARGNPLPHMGEADLVAHWKVANLVIGEFKALLDVYENANEVVKNAEKSRNES